jgi:hypothetical protein
MRRRAGGSGGGLQALQGVRAQALVHALTLPCADCGVPVSVLVEKVLAPHAHPACILCTACLAAKVAGIKGARDDADAKRTGRTRLPHV